MTCGGLILIVCPSGSVPLAVAIRVVNGRWGMRDGSNNRGKRAGNRAANTSLMERICRNDRLNSTAQIASRRNVVVIVLAMQWQLLND